MAPAAAKGSPYRPRALPAQELAEKANTAGLAGKAWPTVTDALNAAKAEAHSSDLIFVGGSVFVVAEVI